MAEAAFLAGAALGQSRRGRGENPPWAGVFRRRLALAAAAASVRRAGRAEDEARLRDALHLRRPGDDAGPAGRRLMAWRALTPARPGYGPTRFDAAAEVVGVKHDDALLEIIEAAEACVAGGRFAPFAAAEAAATTLRILRSAPPTLGSDAELVALWLADAVLAQLLKWPFALPLLAVHLLPGSGRAGPGAAAVDEIGFAPVASPTPAPPHRLAISRPIWSGGRKSCSRSRQNCAPKGRAPRWRRCSTTIRSSAATKIGTQMSERGARRLFDRLVALGAIRELTGRSTFRLYGL